MSSAGLPAKVTTTKLWQLMSQHSGLSECVRNLRVLAQAIAAQCCRVVPSYTNHSVEHMDGLWAVSEQVFTEYEVERFTLGEAFLLACAFYVHDLGMALAATAEGARKLMDTEIYVSSLNRLKDVHDLDEEKARAIALEVAARKLHAEKALELVEEPIPGVGRYLIEPQELREQWHTFIAEISASHHWPISKLADEFGSRGRTPDPFGEEIDLAFVACALRIIDYAHINSDRASYLSRVLRSHIDPTSLVHWRAQEYITGPRRQHNRLVFGSTRPLADVDAWWLFYEMACGLDSEINAVSEFLASRTVSADRLSLEGVKGIGSPLSFSAYVQTDGFEPVDVRFKPGSLERLVEILGGRTLYGDDNYAPLRELLQNARDAVHLQRVVATESEQTDYCGKITVTVEADSETRTLSVRDNGVGMSSTVLTNYLLGVASDYWHSTEFYDAFPHAIDRGFSPAGKYGIGFLSVFMIAREVEAVTERRGGPRLVLRLSGVGRRGILLTGTTIGDVGTTVRLVLNTEQADAYRNLAPLVRARAPMLTAPISIREGEHTSFLEAGWWSHASQEEIYDFVTTWKTVALRPKKEPLYFPETYRSFREILSLDKWPGQQPELVEDSYRVLAMPMRYGGGYVLLCNKGIAIDQIGTPGFVGLMDVKDLELTVARSAPIEWDAEQFRTDLTKRMEPEIVAALNKLQEEAKITSRFPFLVQVGQLYGYDLLKMTQLPWIGILEPPGNVVLVSCDQLIDRARDSTEVLIAYGVNPWYSETRARGHFNKAGRDTLVISVPKAGQPDFGSYKDGDLYIEGPLDDHFKAGNRYRKESLENAVLLVAILESIAAAWECDIDSLTRAGWSRKRSDELCGYLRR